MHFLGAAVLLFVANAVFSGDKREVIEVDGSTQAYLIERHQALMLRPVSPEEEAQVIEDYIKEEILVREARKRGYEKSSRIRTLLIENMRFFMTSETPDATEEELRTFFDANIEQFKSPPSISYEHVFFSNSDDIPKDTLKALRGGADYRQTGDANSYTAKLISTGEREIVATFGREQAPEILAFDDNLWQGPFESANGIHFLRVVERHPSVRPTWASAEGWIETEWLQAKTREITDREMVKMRQNYRIEVAPREPESK